MGTGRCHGKSDRHGAGHSVSADESYSSRQCPDPCSEAVAVQDAAAFAGENTVRGFFVCRSEATEWKMPGTERQSGSQRPRVSHGISDHGGKSLGWFSESAGEFQPSVPTGAVTTIALDESAATARDSVLISPDGVSSPVVITTITDLPTVTSEAANSPTLDAPTETTIGPLNAVGVWSVIHSVKDVQTNMDSPRAILAEVAVNLANGTRNRSAPLKDLVESPQTPFYIRRLVQSSYLVLSDSDGLHSDNTGMVSVSAEADIVMLPFEFTRPALLILILPIAVALGLGFVRSLSDFPRQQRIASLVTRSIICLLLVLASRA